MSEHTCHRVTYAYESTIYFMNVGRRCSTDGLVQMMYCFWGSITLLFIVLLINTYVILCVRSIINIHF